MMNLLKKLWTDDAGVLLSAEAVVVGTVAAAGITAGASTLATSVNAELQELAFSFRSLDQSYCIPAQHGCHGACVAGSSFTQTPVEESLAELREFARLAEEQQQARLNAITVTEEDVEVTHGDAGTEDGERVHAEAKHDDERDHDTKKKADRDRDKAEKKKKNKKDNKNKKKQSRDTDDK